MFEIAKVADQVYAAVAAPAYKVNSNAAIIRGPGTSSSRWDGMLSPRSSKRSTRGSSRRGDS